MQGFAFAFIPFNQDSWHVHLMAANIDRIASFL